MTEAAGTEQDIISVVRTLDFSIVGSGSLDGVTLKADDLAGVHHDELGVESQVLNMEEAAEEKGEEKHVIMHGVEKGDHNNASTLRVEEFLLLAKEFEVDKTEGDAETTESHEGVEDSKADNGSSEDSEAKVKSGSGRSMRTGAAPNRKGPTSVARVVKVARPASKNEKLDVVIPKKKRHGEDSGGERESRSLPTTPSVIRNGARKLTVPQPFALATDKRASLGGRPTDADVSSRLSLASTLKKAAGPVKLAAKLNQTKPSDGPKRYEQGTGKVKNTSSGDDEVRIGSNPYPALKVKPNQQALTNASSFQFKCQERAEKRREFYNKLEERLSAKEAEKTQIEAKTQEEIEAKIKELRKSLTFKANPMPSFYQEAPPPKVELKKIPTTRAKSPKLGTSRRSSGVGTLAEDGRSCRTSRAELEQRLNGLSSGDDGQGKDKKAVKKPLVLGKNSSERAIRSTKSNGRLDVSKAQASGTVSETDVKGKDDKAASADTVGVIDDGQMGEAEVPQDADKVDATSTFDSELADGGSVPTDKDSIGGGTDKSALSPPSSGEAKEKTTKTKQKLKASTPMLSSTAKRETGGKHSSKNSTELAPTVADLVVSS